jgi:hypothetical protein
VILLRKLIGGIVFSIIFLPVFCLVIMPFVALASFFDEPPFSKAMAYRYKRALWYWFWLAPLVGFSLA